MASRLDRLVTILETGSTRLIRDTAVNQLADWQKQHPEELFNIIGRVVPYLRHKDWETRSTAAKALGKIVEHAELYTPNAGEDEAVTKEEPKEEAEAAAGHIKAEGEAGLVKKEESKDFAFPDDELYSLATLDVKSVLKYGRELLRGGTADLALAALDPQDRLAHQKKTLNGRLGLLGRPFLDEEMPVPVDAIQRASNGNSGEHNSATPHDASPYGHDRHHTAESNGASSNGASSTAGQAPEEYGGLSSRQLNVLKRKRKRELQKAAQGKSGFGDLSLRRNATAGSDGFGDDSLPDLDAKKNGKVSEFFTLDRPADTDEDTKVVSEFKGAVAPIKSEIEETAGR